MVLSKNVMIVDDSEGMRELYVKWLARAGYAAFAFSHPEDVLSAVDMGATVDLLVTDYDMKAALDGPALAATLRERGAAFPILLSSGIPRSPHPAITDVIMKNGADPAGFLAKVAELLGREAA